MASSFQQAAQGFASLPIFRQIVFVFSLGCSLALGLIIAYWSQEPEYAPVYAQLDPKDTGAIVDALNKYDIKSKIDYRSNSVLVPTSSVPAARLKLAQEGLPKYRSSLTNFFDQGTPFGTSQFIERAKYLSSLEKELSQTIEQLEPVNTARVHLAVPREQSFVRQNQQPSASVFIQLKSSYQLNSAQISSVANLVAASIPGMKRDSVSITDQFGSKLTDYQGQPGAQDSAKHMEYIQQLEKNYSDRILSLLTPIVGAGRVRAQVTAEVDFNQIEETTENFDPTKSVVRQERISLEQSGTGISAKGIPGAASNTPGAQTQDEEGSGATDIRQNAAKEYDVDRSIRHVKHAPFVLSKLSVAVVLDDKLSYDATSGKMMPIAIKPQELEQISKLVEHAIAFNKSRGDLISINYTPFAKEEPMIVAEKEESLLEKPWFLPVFKQIILGLSFLSLIFLAIRPSLRALTDLEDRRKEMERDLSIEKQRLEESFKESDDPVYMASKQTVKQAKEVNNIKTIIKEDPKRVAQVVMNWVGSE